MARRLFPSSISAILIVSLVVAPLCGCGSGGKNRPPMGKARGKVVYKDNPVSSATVTFTTEGSPRSATGTTNDRGEFELSTYDTGDGAVVGTHKVTITQTKTDPNAPAMSVMDLAKTGAPAKPKGGDIPMKYASLNTTPQKNTVEPGSNNFTIELKD